MPDPVLHRAAAIAPLAARASIEVNPHEVPDALREAATLRRGIEAFLPWLPDTQVHRVAEDAHELRAAGLRPVPHLAARRIAREADARWLADRLADSGVDSVLLVGGDVTQPIGPFKSSYELLETGLLEAAGLRRVGFAAYPEGHPAIAPQLLEDALAAKVAYARAHDLEPFVVSQFCFDGVVIARWLEGFRRRERDIEIRIGVAGPAKLRKLLALGLRCGVGASLRTLRGKAGALSGLMQSPDALLGDLVSHSTRALEDERLGLHVFAFGGVHSAAQWLCSAAKRH